MIKLIQKLVNENSISAIQVRNEEFESLIAIYFKLRYKIPFFYQYSFPIDDYRSKKAKSNFLLLQVLLYFLIKSFMTIPLQKIHVLFEGGFPTNIFYAF